MSPDSTDYKSLLTDPDAFFRERSESPSLKGPLAVVTLIAFLGSLATVVQNDTLVSALRPVIEDALANSSANMTRSEADSAVNFAIQIYLAVSYGFALVGPYVVWLLYGVVFHAISAVFDSEGAFSRTMAFTGWGRVPAVFGSLVTLLVNYYQYEIRGVDVPTDVSAENAFQAVQQIQPPTSIVLLNGLLSIAFTLWAAYIWVYAMKHARSLTRRQALITISIPVLVSLLLTLNNLTSAL